MRLRASFGRRHNCVVKLGTDDMKVNVCKTGDTRHSKHVYTTRERRQKVLFVRQTIQRRIGPIKVNKLYFARVGQHETDQIQMQNQYTERKQYTVYTEATAEEVESGPETKLSYCVTSIRKRPVPHVTWKEGYYWTEVWYIVENGHSTSILAEAVMWLASCKRKTGFKSTWPSKSQSQHRQQFNN